MDEYTIEEMKYKNGFADGYRKGLQEKVKHAQWEDVYGGRYANPRFQCSACKEFALRKSERDWLGTWHEGQALTDFCPHCGAKMDGGDQRAEP